MPALSYAPILVEEPLAYPVAALALYLIVRAVARPSWGRILLAGGGCVLAAATRSQLVALAGVFVLCLLVLGWRTERMRAWRTTWTRFDWVGAALLALGAVLAFSAFMGRHSQEWATTTAMWKDRIFDYGVWAAGALAIGCGVLPLVATIAALIRPWSDWRDAEAARVRRRDGLGTRSRSCWYAAIKGAYLSTIFSSLVVERNLIYLYPLLFTGHRARALAARRALVVGLPATAIVALPRPLDADAPRQLPLLRGARARDPRALQSRARAGRRSGSSTCSSILALLGGAVLLLHRAPAAAPAERRRVRSRPWPPCSSSAGA